MIYNYYNILGYDIYLEKIIVCITLPRKRGSRPDGAHWDNYTFHPVSKQHHTFNCANTRKVVLELCRHFLVCFKVENQQDNVYLIQEILHLVVFYN